MDCTVLQLNPLMDFYVSIWTLVGVLFAFKLANDLWKERHECTNCFDDFAVAPAPAPEAEACCQTQ